VKTSCAILSKSKRMPAAMAAARGAVQISDEDFGGRSSRIGSALASARAGATSIGRAARLNEVTRTAKGRTPVR